MSPLVCQISSTVVPSDSFKILELASTREEQQQTPIQNDHPLISHKPFPRKKQEDQQTPPNPRIKHKEKQGKKNNNCHAKRIMLFFHASFLHAPRRTVDDAGKRQDK